MCADGKIDAITSWICSIHANELLSLMVAFQGT